jgi:predicted metal-binding membrane protein
MMIAMMLPSFAPILWRYRQSVATACKNRPGRLTMLVAAGHFFVWILFGLAIFESRTATAAIEMEQPALARAVPIAAGLVIAIAGAIQFTKWKILIWIAAETLRGASALCQPMMAQPGERACVRDCIAA